LILTDSYHGSSSLTTIVLFLAEHDNNSGCNISTAIVAAIALTYFIEITSCG
jgi:hypothetical protein